MNTTDRQDIRVAVVLLVAAAALPLLASSRYAIGQLTLFCIWALVAVQWNLVFGVSGIFSMAQLAVFGCAGYAAALLVLHAGLPFPLAAVLACLIAGAFGLVIGLAAFRLRGPYVALLTLAVAQALLVLVLTDTGCFTRQGASCLPFTGGARGLSEYGDFGFGAWLPYRHAPLGNYFAALLALAAGTAFAFWLIRSPAGLAFRALRDNPVLAAGRGVDRLRYQLVVFTASSVFTGLAGVLYAAHVRVMGPNVLGLGTLLMVLAMLVVGGLGHRWGPLLGAGLILAIDEVLRELPEWRGTVLGLVLVLSTLLLPSGLAGLRWPLRRARPAAEGREARPPLSGVPGA